MRFPQDRKNSGEPELNEMCITQRNASEKASVLSEVSSRVIVLPKTPAPSIPPPSPLAGNARKWE